MDEGINFLIIGSTSGAAAGPGPGKTDAMDNRVKNDQQKISPLVTSWWRLPVVVVVVGFDGMLAAHTLRINRMKSSFKTWLGGRDWNFLTVGYPCVMKVGL